MMYLAYQAHANLMDLVRSAASRAAGTLTALDGKFDPALTPEIGFDVGLDFLRHAGAGFEVLSRLTLIHVRPPFGIESVVIDGEDVAVSEEVVTSTPFASLLHFRKDPSACAGKVMPKILVVAPMSGHFATLLKATVRTLLVDHDVYITDWHNARDVPVWSGRFGFDEYVDHLIAFLVALGTRSHMLSVCQPCVQVLAAAAVMAEDDHPLQPRSLILMAGPVDTRINPTKVNELATSQPLSWFASNLIATVPWMHAGGGRRVYPGFLQLTAFIAMNPQRHKKAFQDLYDHLARGELAEAAIIETFYDEYCAVLDMPAEFFLETVDYVFQRTLLATGDLTHHGRAVDPAAIRQTGLLTVEGERDDICGLGQTSAAHDLCPSIKPYKKRHHMQPGAGHYGVFSGRRWETQVFPVVRNMILAME